MLKKSEYSAMEKIILNDCFINGEKDILVSDCNNIIYLLENCEIIIPANNRFFVDVNCDGLQWSATLKRSQKFRDELEKRGLNKGEEAKAFSGNFDFSHTTAEWETVISLGIFGLKERLVTYSSNEKNNNKKRFYSQCLRVYEAALVFIEKCADLAKKENKSEMYNGLKNLSRNAPSNLFEVMQTIIIFYILQHMVEGTNLRTLGRLDKLLYDYFKKEEESYATQMLGDFINEIDRLRAPSNIPFAIGGTDIYGNSAFNELSYIILKTYQSLETTNTKFHILCSKNTPDDIIKIAFESIRNGKNSIAFMSDSKVIEALEKLGASHEDAVNYHIVGCYECGAEGELTSSCNARVNIPKAVEYAINKGIDMITGELIGVFNDGYFDTFDAFYAEFEKQLLFLTEKAIESTNIFEEHYNEIHSSPFLSATYKSAMEKGGDLYCDYTAKYNNSSINAIGLATAVDSLAAIRKLVYEDKTVTLHQLRDILRDNWKNYEILRLTVKNKFPKYGVGDKKTDLLAKSIIETLSKNVNGRPNVKGGIWRLGTFSIHWKWELGESTAASADGRLKGETLSLNATASFGADKKGATAHIISATSFDSIHTPNATILDLDFHSSAVKGENGINALMSTLKTYFQLGGFAIHYNVLNTETLKKAQKNPQDFPNLQVRLCGWNVLFSSLSKKEQDEFILRSEK